MIELSKKVVEILCNDWPNFLMQKNYVLFVIYLSLNLGFTSYKNLVGTLAIRWICQARPYILNVEF